MFWVTPQVVFMTPCLKELTGTMYTPMSSELLLCHLRVRYQFVVCFSGASCAARSAASGRSPIAKECGNLPIEENLEIM